MEQAVRETLCTSCMHRRVCKNTEAYMEFLKAFEKLYLEFPKEVGFIEPKDPMCQFYDKKPSSTLR